jgi:hypothetical protein
LAESKIVYFKNPGRENTDEVLLIAKKRAEELGINKIVVASTSGWTGVKAVEVLEGKKLIVISHSTGFYEPDSTEFLEENRKIIEIKGGIILTAAHAFGGINRAMRQGSIPEATATYVIGDIVAATLRFFGMGMKVVCEIAAMAADAGLVRTDEEVIAIGGTGRGGRGADTAVVLQPANAQRLFDLKVKEILCKPRL